MGDHIRISEAKVFLHMSNFSQDSYRPNNIKFAERQNTIIFCRQTMSNKLEFFMVDGFLSAVVLARIQDLQRVYIIEDLAYGFWNFTFIVLFILYVPSEKEV